MVPGDLIEWFYESSREVVDRSEELWSSLLKQWVPIGSSHVHTLVSIDKEQISWLNEKGLFHARVDDVYIAPSPQNLVTVVPRTRG